MNLQDKTDEEIIKIANPLWDNLVKSSNNKDYSGFTKDFSAEMLYGANEVEIGKQWANNDLLVNLSNDKICLGCLRRNEYVTVLYKQNTKILHKIQKKLLREFLKKIYKNDFYLNFLYSYLKIFKF